MNGIASFVQKVYNETPETPDDTNYVRRLKSMLAQKPFLTNVNWKNELFVMNTNRKSADFEKYPELLHANGIIMEVPEDHTSVPKILAYSFNTIRDYTPELDTEFADNFNDYFIEPIMDGAIIRVWSRNNEWMISTIKCIDARDANWSNNKSFRDLFDEASKDIIDYTKLNKDYCYTFVLRHPENHMIIRYDTPSIIHLSTFDMTKHTYVEHDIDIPQIPKAPFDNFKSLQENLATPFEPHVLTYDTNLGYILTHKQTLNKYKFEAPAYARAKELKGNTPNIKYRIIDIIKNNEIEEFLNFFPQYSADVDFVKKRIDGLTSDLYNNYKINPNNQSLSSDLRSHTIRELYWIAREENYINYSRVRKFVSTLSAVRIGILTGVPYLLHQKQFRGKKLVRLYKPW